MKKYFLFFILFSKILFSQNWKEKVFDEVILIKDENVVQSGNVFLINIPLKIISDQKPVFYNASHIPNELFFDKNIFLPQSNEFILISPDKEYYRNVREFSNKIKGHAEPMKTDKFYFVKRNESKWDSISLNSQNYPKIKFKDKKTSVPPNAIVSYYSEFFGSVCCPRDKKRDFLRDNKNDYFFQELKNNGISVKEMYSCSFGEEGEYGSFYPLKELSTEQKLTFIKKRRDFFQQNPEEYRIFFPEIIDYPNLKLRSLN